MFGKVLSVAILAAVFGATSVSARGLGGPAELPPAGYKGQQYVDSRGCVFLRAGYGGQVTWVPRVSSDRKQLCGYPSSGGRVEVAEAAAPAPQEAPVVTVPKVRAAPATVGGTMPKRVVAPVVIAAPTPQVVRPATPSELAATGTGTGTRGTVVAAPTGGAGYQLACPADTPVAERFEIRGGGSKVMCTKGNGSLDGANFPTLVAGSLAGHPIGYDAHVAAGNTGKTGAAPGGTVYASGAVKSTKSTKLPAEVPPAGYKLAWKDDRLNPNRGKQTVAGFMDMDDVWTRTSPAELREDSAIKRRPVKIIVRHRDGSQSAHAGFVVSTKGGGETVVRADGTPVKNLSKSTKSVAPEAVIPKAAPKVAAASGRFLVQVGTYGVSSNAEGAAGRLRGQGLPVARGKLKGGSLTVVYAGPFASAADAKLAMAAARGMGFSDAHIVQ